MAKRVVPRQCGGLGTSSEVELIVIDWFDKPMAYSSFTSTAFSDFDLLIIQKVFNGNLRQVHDKT